MVRASCLELRPHDATKTAASLSLDHWHNLSIAYALVVALCAKSQSWRPYAVSIDLKTFYRILPNFQTGAYVGTHQGRQLYLNSQV